MEQTALQELISDLTVELRSKYDYLITEITDREQHKTHGEIFALNAAIIKAKAKLPKEREQIEKTYKDAWDFGYKHVSTPASQYYETNFNK